MRRLLACAALALALGSLHCGTAGDETASADQEQKKGNRDWASAPAIVEIDDASDVYALSDVHGHYDAFLEVLAKNKLIDKPEKDPSNVKWTGGKAVLVIAGDVIDKGGESLKVIDLLRTLETSAKKSGGRVITTLGNHEVEFIVDPKNDKATAKGQDQEGITRELEDADIDPKDFAKGKDKEGRGRWMRDLPFGVRVGDWFFAHGGNTDKRSLKDLRKKLEDSLDKNGWEDDDISGDGSLLQDQKWYGDPDDDNAGDDEVDALGVKHIAFGHDPGAFGSRGTMVGSKNKKLVKLDTAMGMHEASGLGRAMLLHIKGSEVEVLDEDGKSDSLF